MKTPRPTIYTGFTLIEMLVVVALSTIVTAALFTLIINFYREYDYTIAQTAELQEARRGMRLMIRDLREMTAADDGQFPLVEFASTSILFFSDIDRDDSVELVRYELTDTTMLKFTYDAVGASYSTTTPSATTTLSRFVQNELEGVPIFRYYDATGSLTTATSTVTDVRYVAVDLVVNVDPGRNPGELTLRSSAALRNILETY